MADIQKLTYPYFTDGTTQLNAATLNPIIAKLNEVIDQVNSGVGPTPTQTVATPTISISGTIATISCSTSGATIYYTLNGNTPTTSSTQYSSPITLSGACTIKAIAVKSGMNNSSVASSEYVPTPTRNFVQYTDLNVRRLTVHSQYGYYFSKNENLNFVNTIVKSPVVQGHTYRLVGYLWGEDDTRHSFILSAEDISAETIQAVTDQHYRLASGFYYPEDESASATLQKVDHNFTAEQNGFCYMIVRVSELTGWKTDWYLEDVTQ